jgi:hypothetical protein
MTPAECRGRLSPTNNKHGFQPPKISSWFQHGEMTKGLKRYYGNRDLHFITRICYQRKRWLDARKGWVLDSQFGNQLRSRSTFFLISRLHSR